MPLPPPAARRKLHHRTIHCQGFQREDGLWDIEAQMTDTKTYPFENRDRGEVKAGEPVHLMLLRVTMNLDMEITDVYAEMEYTPFKICPGAQLAMQQLKGLKIGKGWLRKVRESIGRRESCTHLIELLGPLATTAYQTMHKALEQRAEENAKKSESGKRTRPAIIDQCYALSSDSPVVKFRWPEFYSGKDDSESKTTQ